MNWHFNNLSASSVGVPRNSLFLCPAVTPWKTVLPTVGYNNPGIRLYKYDRNTTHVKVMGACFSFEIADPADP